MRPRLTGLPYLMLLAAVLVAAAPLLATQAAPRQRVFTQAELFQPTRVWSAHFTFTKNAWNAIQPTRGARGPNGRGDDDWLQGQPGKRNGWGAIQGIEFAYVHADLEFDGTMFKDVGVRFKGNGTYVNARSSGKIPLKIDFNRYIKGQKIAGLSTLNFHNNIEDEGWMNESIAYGLYRDAGVPSPRTSYVRVYLTVTGQQTRKYLGLYSIVENVDTNFLQTRFAADTGAILKPSTINPFTDRGAAWPAYNQTYDPKTDLTEAEKQGIIAFCKFVSYASDADFAARIGTYVDMDEFTRYFAVMVWLADPDGILERGQNYYVHLQPDTGKFIFIPWDQDHAFGGFVRVVQRDYQTWDIHAPWARAVTFLNRMNKVPAFRTAYRARMKEFSQTLFRPERIAAQVHALAPTIRPAVVDEPARLGAFDRAAAGTAGIVPFANGRTRSVIEQLRTGS